VAGAAAEGRARGGDRRTIRRGSREAGGGIGEKLNAASPSDTPNGAEPHPLRRWQLGRLISPYAPAFHNSKHPCPCYELLSSGHHAAAPTHT
jgi:hypothetical protein